MATTMPKGPVPRSTARLDALETRLTADEARIDALMAKLASVPIPYDGVTDATGKFSVDYNPPIRNPRVRGGPVQVSGRVVVATEERTLAADGRVSRITWSFWELVPQPAVKTTGTLNVSVSIGPGTTLGKTDPTYKVAAAGVGYSFDVLEKLT